MKVRNGFVSNSSSSSFIVCGIEFDNIEQIKEAHTLNGIELTEEDIAAFDGGDYYEFPNHFGFEFKRPDWGQEYYMGVVTDPTYLSVSECVHGFVTESELAQLEKIAKSVGKKVITYGETTYD